jgi:predicted aspartyl protease
VSTFTVQATFIHPEERERSTTLDLLVDTGAFYTLLPPEVVTTLELSAPELRTVEFANGDRAVFRMGEVRVRLGSVERPTLFLAGPPGCHTVLGAFTLEAFALAADPVHQRLVPIPILLA